MREVTIGVVLLLLPVLVMPVLAFGGFFLAPDQQTGAVLLDAQTEYERRAEESRTFGHISARFIIHLFSAAGLYLWVLWAFCELEARVKWWPELRGWWQLIVPAMSIFMFLSFREIFDVDAGDWVWKSVIDWVSWILGYVLAMIQARMLTPYFAQIDREING